jgi:hypothetical protein
LHRTRAACLPAGLPPTTKVSWQRRPFQADPHSIRFGRASHHIRPGKRIGRRLLRLSDRLFEAWHEARDGALEECSFQERILSLRPRVRRALEDGTEWNCAKTARTCAEIFGVEKGLWNFVWFPGVEPTNNGRSAPCAMR